MLGRTHVALGLMTSLGIAVLLGNPFMVESFNTIALLVAVGGALLPDLDMGTSSLAGKFGLLKAKHIKKIWIAILTTLSIGTLFFLKDTPIFYGIALILFLGFIFAKQFAQKGYYMMRNFVQSMTAITVMIGAYYYEHYPLIWIGVILMILLLVKHRSFSHSILFLIGCTLVVRQISFFYGDIDYSLIFGVSMGSHLLGDMLTKAGIGLFIPITHKRIKFPFTIKTGGWVENIVFMGAFLVIFQIIREIAF
ncbi:membrane-bound metal-dependent hydrolase [Alkaliphilus metalliredigens QYMF]|uniref:Membrane-bound metal-dependent hydrolase n=1 Tax=Alkaliphilus metalliredigens (strain QYMF) TaxID=293826 RepID=A6TMK4_ALKMQ|nr:metal-dependent hydrolase [Alkaliphilus metalliredigens]ABR47422.1 membrane-bound metal-dependent hydrolase [Alkaliphilus metalliredigens QYMF]